MNNATSAKRGITTDTMRHIFRCICVLLAAMTVQLACADEAIRQVQEELRKRNLYFGDIDGQTSPELAGAIRRYQTRKGFAATGQIDGETATSLNIRIELAAASGTPWPDVPVLRSDAGRELSEAERLTLAEKAEEQPEKGPAPVPPAESPPPSQDISPEKINKFVEEYLRDAEGQDVASQLRYYSFPVDYFDHGRVDQRFVEKDTAAYVKRWPERKYTLTKPVTFAASGGDEETRVEFSIAFSVRNNANKVTGRTRNFWSVRPEGGALKIVAIREERLRE